MNNYSITDYSFILDYPPIQNHTRNYNYIIYIYIYIYKIFFQVFDPLREKNCNCNTVIGVACFRTFCKLYQPLYEIYEKPW